MVVRVSLAAFSFHLVVSDSTYFLCSLKCFLISLVFLLLDAAVRMVDCCWLEACALALTLKPPNAQQFEVSHLLGLLAQLRGGEAHRPRPDEEGKQGMECKLSSQCQMTQG